MPDPFQFWKIGRRGLPNHRPPCWRTHGMGIQINACYNRLIMLTLGPRNSRMIGILRKIQMKGPTLLHIFIVLDMDFARLSVSLFCSPRDCPSPIEWIMTKLFLFHCIIFWKLGFIYLIVAFHMNSSTTDKPIIRWKSQNNIPFITSIQTIIVPPNNPSMKGSGRFMKVASFFEIFDSGNGSARLEAPPVGVL